MVSYHTLSSQLYRCEIKEEDVSSGSPVPDWTNWVSVRYKAQKSGSIANCNFYNEYLTVGKIFDIDERYSMITSCILHCPHLPPAVTIFVLQDVRSEICRSEICTIRSSCNMGQCQEGGVNIMIGLHSPNSRTLLLTVITLTPYIGLGSLAEVISCQSELGLSNSVESSL